MLAVAAILGVAFIVLVLFIFMASQPSATTAGAAKTTVVANRKVPDKPSWARMTVDERVREAYDRNTDIVRRANQSGTRYDLVMYGDSITARLVKEHAREWGEFAAGWRAENLGMDGSTVEELAWRLMAGGEKLANDPRVVVLLVGLNNVKWGKRQDPSDKLDYLLSWMRAAMPSSKIVLLGLLPNAVVSVAATNRNYAKLAAKYGATFSTCGSDLNPRNPAHFKDGTHPASEGYRRVFACLKPVVSSLL